MGHFRRGLLACLMAGLTAVAQETPTAPVTPAPAPGVDPNAPAPIAFPQPTAPEVDPSVLQPATPDQGAAVQPAPTTPAVKPKPKKPAAPALPTLRGTVASIDRTNMTIVVHGASKDETLKITSKTMIFADNKPAILADAKEGENVLAQYRNAKDKSKEALTLRLGKGAAPAPKKAVAAKKKPAPKRAPADNAAPVESAVTPLPDTNTPPVIVPDPNVPVTPAPTPIAPGANP